MSTSKEMTPEEWKEAVKKIQKIRDDLSENIRLQNERRKSETLPGPYVACPRCNKEVGVQVPAGYMVIPEALLQYIEVVMSGPDDYSWTTIHDARRHLEQLFR